MKLSRTITAAFVAIVAAAACAVYAEDAAPKAAVPATTKIEAKAEVKTYVGVVKVVKETVKDVEKARVTIVVDDKTTLSLRDNAVAKAAVALDGKKVSVTGEEKGKHFTATKIEEVKDAPAPAPAPVPVQ